MTTSVNAGPDQVARAREIARRCGARLVRRRDLGPEDGLRYVVGRDRDQLVQGALRWSVDRGLLHARLAAGSGHPLLRAVGPVGPRGRLVDGTLGACADALHLASAGWHVIGVERSAALYSLAEEGLARLARGGLEAAARIDLRLGDLREELARVGACDVVYADPLFDSPGRAAPGYELLRAVAHPDRFDRDLLERARVVAPRVVLKVPARAEAPIPGGDRIEGGAVDYLVFAAPDAPTSGAAAPGAGPT